tara:strand:- start:556 stop:1302 length:747 start_codon:yes stop_codon:yes gene_type:complete
MAQPTILGTGTNSKAYLPASNSGTDRVYSNIAIPAAANTVIILTGVDKESDQNTISSTAFTGMTGAVELFSIDFTPSDKFRITKFIAFDVSQCGDLTAELTVVVNGSITSKAITGVVCTDGYIESFLLHQDRLLSESNMQSFSKNASNNILLNVGILDNEVTDFSYTGTGVTTIFATVGGSGDTISAVAAFQATNGSGALANVKSMGRDNSNNTDDLMEASLLISSQPNPLADIDPRGEIISHDIITN